MSAYFKFDIITLETTTVITLIGGAEIQITQGSNWVDPGAIAIDELDGDISADIVAVGSVDVFNPGVYTISYNVSNSNNVPAEEVIRTVNVTARVIPGRPYGKNRRQAIYRQKDNAWSLIES